MYHRTTTTSLLLFLLIAAVAASVTEHTATQFLRQNNKNLPKLASTRQLQPHDECYGHYTCYEVEEDGQHWRIFLDEDYREEERQRLPEPSERGTDHWNFGSYFSFDFGWLHHINLH